MLAEEHAPSGRGFKPISLAGSPNIKEADGEVDKIVIDPDMNPEALSWLIGAGDQCAINGPSEEQIAAARIIQQAYRRQLLHRRHTARTDKAEARSRHFLQCWAVSQEMEWPRGPHGLGLYRPMFLGPLPHLLLCLERAGASAFEFRAKAKRHLIEVGYEHLEDA